MRMTILAMPPVIPLVHDELHMSETQVGLLIGLPLALFAIAAVPGSLLIARIGTRLAVVLGMIIAAACGRRARRGDRRADALRGRDRDRLRRRHHAAGMPTLVREWLPGRIALGTIAYTSGMLIGATLPIGSDHSAGAAVGRRLVAARSSVLGGACAPDRRRYFICSSPRHATNSRRGDRDRRTLVAGLEKPADLAARPHIRQQQQRVLLDQCLPRRLSRQPGQADLLGRGLGVAQRLADRGAVHSAVAGQSLQRRAWPFLLFGPMLLASFLGLILVPTDLGHHRVAAALIGFTTAMTLTATLALPALLSAPARCAAHRGRHVHHQLYLRDHHPDHQRRAVGCHRAAVDGVCAAVLCARGTLTVFGTMVVRHRPAAEECARRLMAQPSRAYERQIRNGHASEKSSAQRKKHTAKRPMLPNDRIAYSPITERAAAQAARRRAHGGVGHRQCRGMGPDADRCRARCSRRPPAARRCRTCRTGPGTNTATASASGGSSKCSTNSQIPGVLAINGSALAAYPAIVRAAVERKWEFIGHGFTQRNMQKVANERADIRKDARGDHQSDRQAAARLARPRPHRDLADAGSAGRGRLRLRRRLGARRSAGLAEDARQADRQRALHAGMQRRRHDADPAPQGVGILRARARSVRTDLCRRGRSRRASWRWSVHPYIMGAPHRLKYFRRVFEVIRKQAGRAVLDRRADFRLVPARRAEGAMRNP